jgi:hypothetical protein
MPLVSSSLHLLTRQGVWHGPRLVGLKIRIHIRDCGPGVAMLLVADGMAVLLGLNGPIHIIPTVSYRSNESQHSALSHHTAGWWLHVHQDSLLSALSNGSLLGESSSRPWSYRYEYLKPEPGEARAKGQQRMSG